MKPNINLKSSQGCNVEPGKPLNQNLKNGLEKVSYTRSNGSKKNHCRTLEVNLKTCAKMTKWRVYKLDDKVTVYELMIPIETALVHVDKEHFSQV